MKNRNFLRRPFTYSYNRYTIILILLNVLIFYARRFFQNIDIYFPLNSIAIARYKMYWQFVTYMFMHGNLSHLFFNMLGLLIFGTQVEKTIGSKEVKTDEQKQTIQKRTRLNIKVWPVFYFIAEK